MFEELTVGAWFLIVWRRINDESLTRHRRKAALVAAVLDELDQDVLLQTLLVTAAAATRQR